MIKKKVLVIDDEVIFTMAVKNGLERTGKYQVRIENQGSFGVKVAKEFDPDIIFLDIVMPDMAGDDVAVGLLQDNATRSIPIVFLTAIVSKDEAPESNNVIGNYPFLAKPVTLDQIIDCIECHVC